MDNRLIFLYHLIGVMEGRSTLSELTICQSNVVGCQGLNDLVISENLQAVEPSGEAESLMLC